MYIPSLSPRVATPGRQSILFAVLSLIFTMLLALLPQTAPALAQTGLAVTWYVSPTGYDGNDCQSPATPCFTIGATVVKAGAGDTISLAAGTYYENLTLDKALKLMGAGRSRTIIDGSNAGRVILVTSNTPVQIAGVTIQNGLTQSQNNTLWIGAGIYNAGQLTIVDSAIRRNSLFGPNGDSYAGGIYNIQGAVLTIERSIISENRGLGIRNDAGRVELIDSTVSGNRSTVYGGGIRNTGIVTLTNSTLSSNTGNAGGGIANMGSGTLVIQNSTISDNQTDFANAGGGIYIEGGLVTLQNSIVANNFHSGVPPKKRVPDCAGAAGASITSLGYNLISNATECSFASTTGDRIGTITETIEVQLGPLQNNGGPTPTHAPLPGSPAIDNGNPVAFGSGPNVCPERDQRGIVRPIDGDSDGQAVCDIGAHEANTQNPVPLLDLVKTVAPTTARPGETLMYTITVSATGETALAALTDPLPLGLTDVRNVTGGASFDAATRTIRFSGSVAPGSPVTITCQATVDVSVRAGSVINNTAGVTGTGYLLLRGASVAVADQEFGGSLLLIYSGGDNNLSSEMLHVLNSAERAAGQSDLVTLMVLDGPSVDDSYLYKLEADQDMSCPNYNNPTCGGRYVEGQSMWRWSEDVANPYSLPEFIKGAVRAYPNARQVALSLVGHGGGWTPELLAGQPSGRGVMPSEDPLGGLLWDENPGTSLSTPALGEALRWSTPALKETTGRDKIDLLFLDACFMGMAEVGYELRDSVNYLLASENWKWAVGDYNKLAAAMSAGDVRQIGAAWLTSETDTLHQEGYPFTYSLLNLDALDGLRAASDDLANVLNAALTTDRERIVDAARSTDCFDSNTDGQIAADDNYCDLGSFAQQIALRFGDQPVVVDAARRVADAVATAVVKSEYQSGVPWIFRGQHWRWNNPSGISIFLPLQADNWKRRYYGSLQWGADGSWDALLASWWDNAVPPPDSTCPAEGCGLPTGTLSLKGYIYLPVVVR